MITNKELKKIDFWYKQYYIIKLDYNIYKYIWHVLKIKKKLYRILYKIFFILFR